MTEPATEKGRQAKRAIVSTAAELLLARGVSGTSVDDVLASCGMGKSQFYHYFANKEALLQDVMQYRGETLYQKRFLTPLAQVENLEDFCAWLREFGDNVVTGHYTGGCPAGTLAMQLTQDDVAVRDEIKAIMGALHDAVLQALGRVQKAGQLPETTDLDATAIYILSVFQGGLGLSRFYQEPARLQTALQQVEDHLRRLAVSS